MATFPDYVCISAHGYSEEFDPSVLVTEMERGGSKMRVQNSQVEQSITATLIFNSPLDVSAFESWYFTDVKRIGYFTMQHPRTGQTINARFRGGSIGTLVPLAPGFGVAQREVVIEYLR